MDIHRHPLMDIHGYPWISSDIQWYPWISMGIHGYPLISMGIWISQMIPTGFGYGYSQSRIPSYSRLKRAGDCITVRPPTAPTPPPKQCQCLGFLWFSMTMGPRVCPRHPKPCKSKELAWFSTVLVRVAPPIFPDRTKYLFRARNSSDIGPGCEIVCTTPAQPLHNPPPRAAQPPFGFWSVLRNYWFPGHPPLEHICSEPVCT